VSADHQQPPGDGPPTKPPPAPPGASDVTHRRIKIPVFENVDMMRDGLRAQNLLHRPEDVLVMVAPDIAAELYVWAWVVKHPRCFAYPVGPYLASGHQHGVGDAMRADLIGKIDEYPVIVRGYLDEGQAGMLPYSMVNDNDRRMSGVKGKRHR
jgi:hypothetical protein